MRPPPEVSETGVSSQSSPAKACEVPIQSRRKFLGKVGVATVAASAASVLGGVPKAFAKDAVSSAGGVQTAYAGLNPRVIQAFNLRVAKATADSLVPTPTHTTSGDEQRYSDKSGSYSKPLLQDGICLVNPAAWQSFKKALNSGNMSDYEAIIIGGTRTLNGPQASYAYDLESLDSSQYGNAPAKGDPNSPPIVPPFDQVTSAAYGTQLIEMYWAAMLRDVAFTDYASNATAQAAAAELSTAANYRGPKDSNGNVTPDLLFRGTFQGETVGPYMSQFMITPTGMGQQPIDMLCTTYLPGIDYMTDTTTFLQVQNGIDTGLRDQVDPVRRYLHDWRGLGALTHVDVLYQEYFNALLMMATLNVPTNPGNPYSASKTQNGFCTFGGPDFAACMAEVAARALVKVWYQKWLVHLTHRPEWGGGLVHQALTGSPLQAVPNANVLNSQAVAQSFSKYGTYLLSQAFPEGSPAHPSYPTGHGTVGGACITILKFFFDGNYVIPNPMMPTNDGLSLVQYTGGDAGQITVNSELNKLARNVSFGHGVGAGIHWRTDTDYSMTLGEAMAISFLRDKAQTYHEKFSVSLTKLDGTVVTISNK
jgi:hypothetical protein